MGAAGKWADQVRFQQHALDSKRVRFWFNADLAATSSAVASSTLDPAHGAALAVDALDSSFWVSKLDEISPITSTVELDEPARVLEVGLNFEFVPSAFSLQTSSGAGKWTDVYSTDTNVLKTTTVPLTGHFVHGVRLVMNKAHATECVLEGHSLYGMRSFKVMSPQMRTVLESCAVAAKSGDARDQYFAVALVHSYVLSFLDWKQLMLP